MVTKVASSRCRSNVIRLKPSCPITALTFIRSTRSCVSWRTRREWSWSTTWYRSVQVLLLFLAIHLASPLQCNHPAARKALQFASGNALICETAEDARTLAYGSAGGDRFVFLHCKYLFHCCSRLFSDIKLLRWMARCSNRVEWLVVVARNWNCERRNGTRTLWS